MKKNRHNRGSVLMEFIIVLPIYIILFGGVFMWGDMAVHSIRLASADRTMAFYIQQEEVQSWKEWDGMSFVKRMFEPHGISEIADGGQAQNNIRVDAKSFWWADEGKKEYPWTLRAAVKVRDDYLLPAGGVAARLAFANKFFSSDHHSSNNRGDDASSSFGKWEWERTHPGERYPVSRDGQEGEIGRLFEGTRVRMYAKEERERPPRYNYYTLNRTRFGNVQTWRDNRRYASDLVAQKREGASVWDSQVFKDPFHETVNDEESGPRHFSSASSYGSVNYERYNPFKTWSK